MRERLKDDRKGITKKAQACGFEYYCTVNFYEDGIRPAEVFFTIAKQGSVIAGFARTVAVILSIALQSGVPWETLYKKMEGIKFDPRDDMHPSLVDAAAHTINEMVELEKSGKRTE